MLDFPTPEFIRQAGIDFINKGFILYTPASGTMELKKAIVESMKKNGHQYKLSEDKKMMDFLCQWFDENIKKHLKYSKKP